MLEMYLAGVSVRSVTEGPAAYRRPSLVYLDGIWLKRSCAMRLRCWRAELGRASALWNESTVRSGGGPVWWKLPGWSIGADVGGGKAEAQGLCEVRKPGIHGDGTFMPWSGKSWMGF